MEQNQIREWMREGIEAARNNNKIIARDFFRRVLEVEPNNELAWMWMAQAADRTSDRRQALERVLEINPRNERAMQALARLDEEYGGYTPSASGASMSDSVGSALRTNAQNEAAAESARQSVEQQRDWLRPVSRQNMPSELWAKNRRQNNNLLMYLLGAVAIAFIGFAAFLLIGQLNEDDSDNGDSPTATLLSQADQLATAQILALTPSRTPLPPSNTPRPTSALQLTPTATGLPRTAAPTLTSTPPPTATNTPGPTEPEVFSIIYAANSAPGEPSRLYRANGDGSEPEFLEFSYNGQPIRETSSPDDAVRIELLDPALSPSGEFVAFTMEIDGIQEIFVAPDRGGEVFQISLSQASQTRGVAWHPNGEILAYYSNQDGDFDIYTTRYDAQAESTNITNNTVDDRYPAWSPNGDYMALASDRYSIGNLEIFVINISGEITPPDEFGRTPFAGECQLTDGAGDSFAPAWSPDAQNIVFITTRDLDADLYIMSSDGSRERNLSVLDNSVDWQEQNPAWSPDGSWILVASNRLEVGESGLSPVSKLWLTTPRGDIWRQITEGESNDTAGSWFAILPEFRPDVSNYTYTCAN